jgi:hypothetical protein
MDDTTREIDSDDWSIECIESKLAMIYRTAKRFTYEFNNDMAITRFDNMFDIWLDGIYTTIIKRKPTTHNRYVWNAEMITIEKIQKMDRNESAKFIFGLSKIGNIEHNSKVYLWSSDDCPVREGLEYILHISRDIDRKMNRMKRKS